MTILARMPRLHRLALLLALVAFGLPATASARVPQGFVGVDAGGPLFNSDVSLSRQMDTMVASGVQSVRVVFNWSAAQPSPGGPIDFAATDAIVAAAAAHGMTVLPTVLYAPGWDATGAQQIPARTGPYAAYLTALIGRYGPRGSFWANHPRHPIRMWQIWNEENLPVYWPQPFARSYAKLLAASHAAIKRADPGAKVVSGALTNVAWRYLGQLNHVRGALHSYDMIAINGFTSTPARVIEFLQLMRRGADRTGARSKPILATELSWPSSRGHDTDQFDWDTTERGQARNVGALLPLLAAHRSSLRLAGFYYYTWVTQPAPHDNFNYAGLLSYDPGGRIVAKPALRAFRAAALRIEGCKRKGRTATACVR